MNTSDDSSKLDSHSKIKKSRNPAQKRKRTTERHKWTEEEDKAILEYAQSSLQSGTAFEKPSAPDYYRKFQTTTKLEKLSSLPVDKLIQHMKTLKKSYTDTVDWRNQTGQGILEQENGVVLIKDMLEKRCKFFKDFDEILGTKINIQPPFIFHSEEDTASPDTPESEDPLELNESQTPNYEVPEPFVFQEKEGKPKILKSKVKSVADTFEKALMDRTLVEERRLNWEKERHQADMEERNAIRQSDIEHQYEKLKFEREKWDFERRQVELEADRKHELEKLKLQHELETAKYRINKEFDLDQLKLSQMSK